MGGARRRHLGDPRSVAAFHPFKSHGLGRDGPHGQGHRGFHLPGDAARWKRVRGQIHQEVCGKGFDPSRNTFTQYYGSRQVDASLLMIPLVGFLSPHDPRVQGTVQTIEKELFRDGLVQRHSHHGSQSVDGLPAGEGTFLACSFWLVNTYVSRIATPKRKSCFSDSWRFGTISGFCPKNTIQRRNGWWETFHKPFPICR